MEITREQLEKIMPGAGKRIDKYLSYLNAAMMEFGINTGIRQAHFLAQVAHESGQLRYTKELASGMAYEGRKDLGNTHKGDGMRFKGRGFLQLTGRANYTKYKIYCGYDVVGKPDLLEQPRGATRSAAWVFTRGLGTNLCYYADLDVGENTEDILKMITKRINGGYNGLDSRRKFLVAAKKALLLQ